MLFWLLVSMAGVPDTTLGHMTHEHYYKSLRASMGPDGLALPSEVLYPSHVS